MDKAKIFVEAFGILGFLVNVWANVLLVHMSTMGWCVRLGANVLWFTYGVCMPSFPNIISSITFAGINTWGLIKWRRGATQRHVAQSKLEAKQNELIANLEKALANRETIIQNLEAQITIHKRLIAGLEEENDLMRTMLVQAPSTRPQA